MPIHMPIYIQYGAIQEYFVYMGENGHFLDNTDKYIKKDRF